MPTPEKICPACAVHAPISAPSCTSCGHTFRTKFTPPVEQTQFFTPEQLPPPYAPPQYPVYPHAPQGYQPAPPPYTPPPIIIYNAPQMLPPGTIQVQPGTHSVALAIILAFFITGTGQMVNKQGAKGVVLLLSAILFGALTLGIGWAVIGMASFIDAICIANRLNRGEDVGPWQSF
jgi:TM2 domain-containing membrane protein YozV